MENKPLATKTEVWTILFLSFFFIVFMWGIWTREIFALGINFAAYLASITLFAVWRLQKNGAYSKNDLAWVTPLLLISLSFALYENPFFKAFSLLVFPVVASLFYASAWVDKKNDVDWDALFISKIVAHVLSFFTFLKTSVRLLSSTIYSKEKTETGIVKRVVTGVIILTFSLLIIIPLLSSADPMFASKLKPLYDAVTRILSTSIVAKIIVFAVLSIGTLTALIAWGRPYTVENDSEKSDRDIIITSIVLGGIFLVYLFFLWIQLDRLWVGALPFDFKETESLVKSGFWQLLFLSLVNLAIFFFLYRRTAPLGQKFLGAFSLASVLLLVSSAHRMLLYVTYYGFSYEKFYALYAVLFCAVLFIWLISRLFVEKKSNVVKFLAFQFLWMFALVSVFPAELFILETNLYLVKKADTKIKLHEMTMLSPDVLPAILKYAKEGKLREEIEYSAEDANGGVIQTSKEYDWNPWIEKQETRVKDKKWYEATASSLLARKTILK